MSDDGDDQNVEGELLSIFLNNGHMQDDMDDELLVVGDGGTNGVLNRV